MPLPIPRELPVTRACFALIPMTPPLGAHLVRKMDAGCAAGHGVRRDQCGTRRSRRDPVRSCLAFGPLLASIDLRDSLWAAVRDSQVNVLDLRVVPEFTGGPLQHGPAGLEHVRAVGHLQ